MTFNLFVSNQSELMLAIRSMADPCKESSGMNHDYPDICGATFNLLQLCQVAMMACLELASFIK